jgi:hypothetical protein
MVINKSKQILLGVAIVFGLLCVFALVIFITRRDDSSNNPKSGLFTGNVTYQDTPCSVREQGSILSEAVPLFLLTAYNVTENSDRPEKLFALEQRILEQENYLQDANCLHILTMIYINRGDISNSEKYLALLTEGLDVVYPESYILDENANFKSIEEMRESINFIKNNNQLQEQNNPFRGQNRLDEKIE